MKIALVYDHINKIGGAERILEALHELFPKAPLYTLVADTKKAKWAKKFQIHTSFVQNIPGAKSYHEFFPILPIFAFEKFNFDDFDVVISVTSAEAKGIITSTKTLHICYCLTPTRYIWSHYREYFSNKWMRRLSYPVVVLMRMWDVLAANRPDEYVTISNNVSKRIYKYYRRHADLIYPPVDVNKFTPQKNKTEKDNYFLVVSRLVKYKHVEIAIDACNQLNLPLKIIGDGFEKNNLKEISGPTIEFLGNLTDSDLIRYYQGCRALIFAQEEDFGITAVEALSCGKPVIAFGYGGAKEIITEGITGEFFYKQNKQALAEKLANFDDNKYLSKNCWQQAQKFSVERFKFEFLNYIISKRSIFK